MILRKKIIRSIAAITATLSMLALPIASANAEEIVSRHIPNTLAGLFRMVSIIGSIPVPWHVQRKSTIRAVMPGTGSTQMEQWHATKMFISVPMVVNGLGTIPMAI